MRIANFAHRFRPLYYFTPALQLCRAKEQKNVQEQLTALQLAAQETSHRADAWMRGSPQCRRCTSLNWWKGTLKILSLLKGGGDLPMKRHVGGREGKY